jgi:ferritin-like metal-binding protein YciE
VTELQELRSVEDQLVQALPKMVEAAKNPELKKAIQTHLDETRSQRERLDQLLKRHGAGSREHQDGSMQAIVGEADRWAKMVQDPDLRDAGLIAPAQRVDHHEVAVYGTLATWAKQLGLHDDLQVLLAILEEENSADEKLSTVAKQVVNPEALQA